MHEKCIKSYNTGAETVEVTEILFVNGERKAATRSVKTADVHYLETAAV
jgi:hypothetical protein